VGHARQARVPYPPYTTGAGPISFRSTPPAIQNRSQGGPYFRSDVCCCPPGAACAYARFRGAREVSEAPEAGTTVRIVARSQRPGTPAAAAGTRAASGVST
jgi:hypothetical protein